MQDDDDLSSSDDDDDEGVEADRHDEVEDPQAQAAAGRHDALGGLRLHSHLDSLHPLEL